MRISDWSSDVCSSDLSRDIFEHLDLGAMIHAEVRHRSGFGAIVDYSFMDLSGDSDGPVVPGAEIKAEVFQCILEAFASYRFEITPQHKVDAYGRSEEHTSELQSLMRN